MPCIAVSPNIMESAVGDELVLLDLDKGVYFGLDAIGAVIWSLAKSEATVASICEHLMQIYDVELEEVTVDVRKLLAELQERGIIALIAD